MSVIIIYADGGCRGNQNSENIGGWGAVLTYRDNRKEIYGGVRNTTNNKMELTACIKALEEIKTTNRPIELYADSAYVVNGMNQWVAGWVKRGWKKADKKPVENQDLWKRLLELSKQQKDIKFIKVKGHDGVELNEVADQLANRAMNEVE